MAEPLIYVGPSVKGTSLQQFTIYSEGIPAFVQADIARTPGAGAHFIPLSQYAATHQQYAPVKPLITPTGMRGRRLR